MSKKSFDECYCTSINDIECLDEVATFVENHDGNLGKYENSMFCPECRYAELSYVHKTSKKRAFLRRKPSTIHLPWCSYNYEYSSPQFSKEYYESLSDEQIQDKIASMMRSLLQEKPVESNSINEVNIVKSDNPLILENEKNGQRIRRSLRRKKLCSWLDEEIAGVLHIFYGEVKLKVRKIERTNNEDKPYSYYFLDIFCKNKRGDWKRRTQIYRASIRDDIDENKVYHFVAVGTLNFSSGFPKLELSNKQSILFKVLE